MREYKPVSPATYFAVLGMLSLLFFVGYQEYLDATKKLTDLKKITGVIRQAQVRRHSTGRATLYDVEFSLENSSELFTLEEGTGVTRQDELNQLLPNGAELTVYFDKVNRDSENKVYQIESRSQVLYSIKKFHSNAVGHIVLLFFMAVFISVVPFSGYLINRTSSETNV